ncbi:hypothetical protein RhiJN_10979 [Ceratobasidium sp. AG-Ba]|nr:hypothetical protein RhiJN_10979 [Ceratobasidium sp. AG-Ba]
MDDFGTCFREAGTAAWPAVGSSLEMIAKRVVGREEPWGTKEFVRRGSNVVVNDAVSSYSPGRPLSDHSNGICARLEVLRGATVVLKSEIPVKRIRKEVCTGREVLIAELVLDEA